MLREDDSIALKTADGLSDPYRIFMRQRGRLDPASAPRAAITALYEGKGALVPVAAEPAGVMPREGSNAPEVTAPAPWWIREIEFAVANEDIKFTGPFDFISDARAFVEMALAN